MRNHHPFFLVARERLERSNAAVERMLDDRNDPANFTQETGVAL